MTCCIKLFRYYTQLFIIFFKLVFLRSGLLGRVVFFMQFGLIMIKFSKCKNYFIKPINCFVQMLYKAGLGFLVFGFCKGRDAAKCWCNGLRGYTWLVGRVSGWSTLHRLTQNCFYRQFYCGISSTNILFPALS